MNASEKCARDEIAKAVRLLDDGDWTAAASALAGALYTVNARARDAAWQRGYDAALKAAEGKVKP